MKPMKYKGYIAKIEYDDEDSLFYGEVVNVSDVIDFKGSSVEELRESFQDSIDSYLEFCEEMGRQPEKPYSGNFHVRATPELHRDLMVAAKMQSKSFNEYVVETLKQHSGYQRAFNLTINLPENSRMLENQFQVDYDLASLPGKEEVKSAKIHDVKLQE